MTVSPLYLMTGITSGLGLVAAQNLAKRNGAHIITGVRSSAAREALRRFLPEGSYTALDLDQASLASVYNFAKQLRAHIAERTFSAMVLNAGLQVMTGLEKTVDGIETTFAVNHLSHWLIHDLLSDRLNENSRVVLTGNGTHDPQDPVASKFGFRGGMFPSAASIADGAIDPSANANQQCLDRYATSKLCNIMMMLHNADTAGDKSPTMIAFDPGLMPGTNLARDRGAIERFAWHNLMPVFGRLMTGVSSAKQSGAMLADIASGEHPARSGEYIEYTGRRLEPSKLARTRKYQQELDDYSRELSASIARKMGSTGLTAAS
ncbi:MAG: SDR family NAD(P)-dependent oxidoreductase [Erythrobacter sp.]